MGWPRQVFKRIVCDLGMTTWPGVRFVLWDGVTVAGGGAVAVPPPATQAQGRRSDSANLHWCGTWDIGGVVVASDASEAVGRALELAK